MAKTGFGTKMVRLFQQVKPRMETSIRRDSSGLNHSSLPKSDSSSQESFPTVNGSVVDSIGSSLVQRRPTMLLMHDLTTPREPFLTSEPLTRSNQCGTKNGASSSLTQPLVSILATKKLNNMPTSGLWSIWARNLRSLKFF